MSFNVRFSTPPIYNEMNSVLLLPACMAIFMHSFVQYYHALMCCLSHYSESLHNDFLEGLKNRDHDGVRSILNTVDWTQDTRDSLQQLINNSTQTSVCISKNVSSENDITTFTTITYTLLFCLSLILLALASTGQLCICIPCYMYVHKFIILSM